MIINLIKEVHPTDEWPLCWIISFVCDKLAVWKRRPEA